MTTFTKEFALFLHSEDNIQFGEFTLASGRTSPYYIDLRQLLAHSAQYKKMVDALAAAIASNPAIQDNCSLVSVPTGGLVVAASLAYATGSPLAYVRKEAKAYGTGKRVEGGAGVGSELVMIEDVVSTGGSIIDALGPLREEGLAVRNAYAVIDRMRGTTAKLAEEGVALHSLVTIVDIVRCLFEEGRISGATVTKVLTDAHGDRSDIDGQEGQEERGERERSS